MTLTLTLTLTPEKESQLADQARAAGLSLDDYIQGVIDHIAEPSPLPRTGADLLAQWEREGALLPADDTLDAPALARRTRETAQRRGQA